MSEKQQQIILDAIREVLQMRTVDLSKREGCAYSCGESYNWVLEVVQNIIGGALACADVHLDREEGR